LSFVKIISYHTHKLRFTVVFYDLVCTFAEQCKTLSITVSIDALAMVPRQTKIANLYEIIVESAVRNLRLLENTIVDKFERLQNKISLPEVFHFYPEDCGHFVTKIYLKNDDDESLCNYTFQHKIKLMWRGVKKARLSLIQTQ
jgi:hypothetical protein